MKGDGQGSSVFDIAGSGVDGFVGRVTLGCGGDVDGGVGERDAALGHADEFGSLLRCDGDAEGIRVRETDVFAGGDDDATGDEADIFAGVEHFGQPVDGGVGVAAAHGFDEGADGVVMGVTVSIVDDGFLLDGFFGDGEVDANGAVIVWRSRYDSEFDGVKQFSGIAIAAGHEVSEGTLGELDFEFAEAAFVVGDSAAPKVHEGIVVDGF